MDVRNTMKNTRKCKSLDSLNDFEGKTLTNHEGYLYKKHQSVIGFPKSVWKKKYMKLKDGCLYITRTKGDVILHEKTKKVEIKPDTGIYPENDKKDKPRFYLRVNFCKKSYIFRTDNETERNTWLAALLTVMTQTFVKLYKQNSSKLALARSSLFHSTEVDTKNSNEDHEIARISTQKTKELLQKLEPTAT